MPPSVQAAAQGSLRLPAHSPTCPQALQGRRDSIAFGCPQLTPISLLYFIHHSSLLINIINATDPMSLATPLHPPSAHPAAVVFFPFFTPPSFPPCLTEHLPLPPFSPCWVTNQNPVWIVSRSKLADRLEKMGKHLLQDSLMLVGTDDSSNLFFPYRRLKVFS